MMQLKNKTLIELRSEVPPAVWNSIKWCMKYGEVKLWKTIINKHYFMKMKLDF